MRPINATNFEQSNVEFIEFWLLDTFSEIITEHDDLGELYFPFGEYFGGYTQRRTKTI